MALSISNLFLFASLLMLLVLVLAFLLLRRQRNTQKNLDGLQHLLNEHINSFSLWTAGLDARLTEKGQSQQQMTDSLFRLINEQQKTQQEQRTNFDKHQISTLKTLQDSLQSGMTNVRQQVTEALTQHADMLNQRVEKLTHTTDNRLKEISGQVEKRLTEGFEKTTATFTDVVKRLALIDEAQKKITELSTNVVSLQDILTDKRSRGAFGEVQLMGLIRNMMPENTFSFQHTLSNKKRADCMLFLPEPTGHIVIDSKFPLESYQQLSSIPPEGQRATVEQAFRQDIRKHINDIADKYILPGETADGAMMFIPAEAVFAEIHAYYPDLVETAQKARVWMVSPTTMMAILTTARAVLKDAATRKQVHIIQEHLGMLSKDFKRFQERMNKLAQHIKQAHEDAENVHTSSRKISRRFEQIEQVQITQVLLEEE
ncbi:MAG: RmuC family protein [Gammaproteobacteria bacterium]|jgi:DNA recombination protein RmuC|nr:RmuC family protein [Gammaproteobacteria bacterium]